MQIGDKVRMLRGKEEGIVTKIINEKLVEVEIEDGFRIPTLRSDLVVVAAEESNYFEREEQVAATPERSPKGKAVNAGFCLAFHAINDRILSVFIINNTKNIIPFSIFYQDKAGLSAKTAGHLNPFSHIKLDEFDRINFDLWPDIIIQALLFEPKGKQLLSPLEKKLKFKASSFFKNEKLAPIILKQAYIFEINTPITISEVEKLSERLLGGAPQDPVQKGTYVQPNAIIDLHIEKLVGNASSLPTSQILTLQLEAFEKALDSAIAAGLQEITFIHGVGSGVLRDAIHKKLSKHEQVEYYKDAMKEKFGYGATVAKIA